MSRETNIEWCDATFNPWRGCTKVSPGCAHCYAERQSHRNPKVLGQWGKGAPRVLASESYWRQPVLWNRAWEREDKIIAETRYRPQRRPRVFCASLADVLDDEVPIEWLIRLLALIRSTPNLDWLLLTKRPQNFRPRMEAAVAYLLTTSGPLSWGGMIGWLKGWALHGLAPENVWLGTSVEDQERADERIPALLRIPAKVRFLSCEPLLGPVNIGLDNDNYEPFKSASTGLHWVIVGGESGPRARPMHPQWARDLRDQCAVASVAFHFKQWGEFAPGERTNDSHHVFPDGQVMHRVGKKAAGRLLDSREHSEWPA